MSNSKVRLFSLVEIEGQITGEQQEGSGIPGLLTEIWARDVRGRRQVQLIVTSNSTDRQLTALRTHVVGLGGAVHAQLPLISGLSVQLPADRVDELAARADVVSISPNRAVRRTSSQLEVVSGTLTSNVRSYKDGNYSGLDGSGWNVNFGGTQTNGPNKYTAPDAPGGLLSAAGIPPMVIYGAMALVAWKIFRK